VALTAKQQLFVAEYLIDLNATQAAIRAGYSAGSAHVNGSRLLSNASVAAAIADGQRALLNKLGASAERVMQINAAILEADMAEAYGPDGKMLHVRDMPKSLRLALKKHKVRRENVTAGDGEQDTTIELELEGKSAAIERDYKRHGLLIDKVEHAGGVVVRWQE
jgi:phage terminase small subunit